MYREALRAGFGVAMLGKCCHIILRRFCGEIIDMINANIDLSLSIQCLERYRCVA